MNPSDFNALRSYLATRIIGQQALIESMLVCLLSDGHMLLEGMPGLAKTTAVKALAEGIEGDFHRVQFTPDLLPADLIGSDIYRQKQESFEFRRGPLFHNIVLADEVNRAPAKVQSALLEAMGERQVTVGQHTYALPDLYMVLATQNPIEQEGTYPLPEAQVDRFLMHVWVDYPQYEEELAILALDHQRQQNAPSATSAVLSQEAIFAARQEVAKVHVSPNLCRYIVDLVVASRNPARLHPDLARWRRFGASPRASLALARCARAYAWLAGDAYVGPGHIQAVAPNILRHRILLSFEGEAEGVTPDQFVRHLLEVVAVP